MEQKDIDIYEILKGMPDGTPLYTPICGEVEFTCLESNKEAGEVICIEYKNGTYCFDKNGKWTKGGEVLLFPSKEMRDWSKFAWKKGDVLTDEERFVVFKGFNTYDYTEFSASFEYEDGTCRQNLWFVSNDFRKVSDNIAQEIIKKIEEHYGCKFNLETLEIEQPAFEIGKLYVFDEEDEDGNVTVIGKLIGKNESKDTLTFGNQYEIETEKFVTDQAFDLRISVHDELREATEGEYCTFQEACTLWEKKAKGQPAFKTFDKVLVRDSDTEEWEPAIFLRMSKEEEKKKLPYQVYSLYYGFSYETAQCTPYEGNEHLAFTSDPF